jgi:hypothetical protein
MKHLRQDDRCPGRNSNKVPSKSKSEENIYLEDGVSMLLWNVDKCIRRHIPEDSNLRQDIQFPALDLNWVPPDCT